MSLEAELLGGSISPLVREEGNIIGQPGGGPLTSNVKTIDQQRFIAAAQAVADASGDAEIALGSPGVGFAWLVERISVTGGGAADFFVLDTQPQNLVDYTSTATKDIADQFSPIYVPGGQHFIAVFSGAGADTICTVRFQARLVQDA